MAKKIELKNYQLRAVMDNVHRGKSLTQEAYRLGIGLDELTAQGDIILKNVREWEKTKKESASRDKKQSSSNLRKATKKAKSVSTPNMEFCSAPEAEPQKSLIEILLEKEKILKEKMEEKDKEVKSINSKVVKTEEEVNLLEIAFERARNALLRAQENLDHGRNNLSNAKEEYLTVGQEFDEIKKELELVQSEIMENKKKCIYLVEPWFKGNVPEFGTFISVTEVGGVCVKQENVSNEYVPEVKMDDVVMFDFVPDYQKAMAFIGLVTMYELQDTNYSLLVSDERVKKLLKKYVE